MKFCFLHSVLVVVIKSLCDIFLQNENEISLLFHFGADNNFVLEFIKKLAWRPIEGCESK